MSQEPRPEIGDEEKLRLADFVMERVRQGLAGRDGEDLIGSNPSRILFAGVLAPLPDGASAPTGAVPAGTSLGLDFRIRPTSRGGVRLRVRPRWSVYYPIFPNLPDVIRANRVATQG